MWLDWVSGRDTKDAARNAGYCAWLSIKLNIVLLPSVLSHVVNDIALCVIGRQEYIASYLGCSVFGMHTAELVPLCGKCMCVRAYPAVGAKNLLLSQAHCQDVSGMFNFFFLAMICLWLACRYGIQQSMKALYVLIKLSVLSGLYGFHKSDHAS